MFIWGLDWGSPKAYICSPTRDNLRPVTISHAKQTINILGSRRKIPLIVTMAMTMMTTATKKI